MGGPLQWSVIREKRISGSSCEAEIKAMDEGTAQEAYNSYDIYNDRIGIAK